MSDVQVRRVDGFVGRGCYGWVRGKYAVSIGRLSSGDYLVVFFQGTTFVGECQVETPPRTWIEAVSLFAPGGRVEAA